MQTESSPRLDGIQVLRGMAAMMVALGHYHGTAAARGFELKLFDQIAIAAIGVDIFFVISGFIMELTVRPRVGVSGSAVDFLVRRAIRLLPLYWVLTLLAYLLSKSPMIGVNAQYTIEALAYSMLLLPLKATDGSASYLISVAWSLTYEVYFYLLFALFLTAAPRIRMAGLLIIFTAAILAGTTVKPSSPLARMAADPMLLEFLAGCVLGFAFKTGYKLPRWASIASISLALIWLLGVLEFKVPDGERIFWWGIPSTLLVCGVVLHKSGNRIGVLKPFVALGNVSYSLYLTHFFTLALFSRLLGRWPDWILLSPAISMLAFSILCIAVSAVCYQTIEVPSRVFLGKLWQSRFAR